MKKIIRTRSEEERLIRAEQYLLATVAFVLADAMARSGVSQREIARRLDVSDARISQILNAAGNPTVRSLARIADALNCRVKFDFAELDPVDRRTDVQPRSASSSREVEDAATPQSKRPRHLRTISCEGSAGNAANRETSLKLLQSTEYDHGLAA